MNKMDDEEQIDENGNIIFARYGDYYERNTYNKNNKLIRSEQHYGNGIVEVEQFYDDTRSDFK